MKLLVKNNDIKFQIYSKSILIHFGEFLLKSSLQILNLSHLIHWLKETFWLELLADFYVRGGLSLITSYPSPSPIEDNEDESLLSSLIYRSNSSIVWFILAFYFNWFFLSLISNFFFFKALSSVKLLIIFFSRFSC